MRKLKAALLTALSCAAVGCVMPEIATASADTRDFMCTYTAVKKGEQNMLYGSSAVNTYTAEEAAAAGIPAGYENGVLEILRPTSQTSCGILLDFYNEQVPISIVKNLQFRVYLESNAANAGNYPEIRVPDPTQANAWIHQPGVATATGEWTTVTVDYNGKTDSFEIVVEEKPKYKLGDVNGNGEIDKYDYIHVKRFVLHTLSFTDVQQLAADVDVDGNVNIYDYILIKRHVMETYVIA
jgi:hypothetical protein